MPVSFDDRWCRPAQGQVLIGVPIDVPFTEIDKVVEAQFAGRNFPEDGSGSVDVSSSARPSHRRVTGC